MLQLRPTHFSITHKKVVTSGCVIFVAEYQNYVHCRLKRAKNCCKFAKLRANLKPFLFFQDSVMCTS